MTADPRTTARLSLLLQLVLVVAVFVAFALGGDAGTGAVSAGVVLAAVVAFEALRRRGGTGEVLTGIGDERARLLYQRASAIAAHLTILVLVGWWLVTVAQGAPNETLSILGAVFGLSWLVVSLALARRG
jgi:hypothetical protein